MIVVRVPASSANLGPGFDTLGMALTLHFELGFVDDQPDVAALGDTHPAVRAFRCLGGTGDLWARSPIPMGRGLGFSGAARIAGLVAAVVQREGSTERLGDAYDEILRVATQLEGHADNVAASLYGGVVATAGGRAVRVPLAFDPTVVAWVPSFQISTDESRGRLGATVTLADAVFNIGHTALLVAALASGDVDALRCATEDRIHQTVRFAAAEPSRQALQDALDAGAWCGWLSGSGPTVAALCASDQAEKIAAALPSDGVVKVLRIDHDGALVEG